MEFAWAPEHEEFRRKIKAAIDRLLPSDWAEKSQYDTSSEYVSKFSRTFCPALAKEGLLIPHWPKELGGGGLDPYHHWVLGEEMIKVGEPRSYQYMNVNWAGPAIIRFGTDEQKQQHISKIVAGTHIWCQGFSEPSAGSDLAAIRTTAERTPNGYVINGSKIWTSGASLADFCFMLARTGTERYGGISVFLVPMKTPGIDVRIIPCLVGERSVHEVFFTNVEVPESARLGDENDGWKVVRAVMHNERVGMPRYALSMRVLDHAVGLLKKKNRFKDAAVRSYAAKTKAALEAARNLMLNIIDDRMKGKAPTATTSVARYALVTGDRWLLGFLNDFMYEEVMSGKDPLINVGYKRTGSTGIGAGSAEIQLNLIARDMLRLPRE